MTLSLSLLSNTFLGGRSLERFNFIADFLTSFVDFDNFRKNIRLTQKPAHGKDLISRATHFIIKIT